MPCQGDELENDDKDMVLLSVLRVLPTACLPPTFPQVGRDLVDSRWLGPWKYHQKHRTVRLSSFERQNGVRIWFRFGKCLEVWETSQYLRYCGRIGEEGSMPIQRFIDSSILYGSRSFSISSKIHNSNGEPVSVWKWEYWNLDIIPSSSNDCWSILHLAPYFARQSHFSSPSNVRC